jgi:aspartate racemase
MITQKISQELELGIIKEENLSAFLKIVQRMKDENRIQAIILGYT